MKTAFSVLSLVFVLCLIVGPKSLMQVSAWGIMIADYSQEGTLRSAVKDTFSGERPCDMCASLSEVTVEIPDMALSSNILLKNLHLFLQEDKAEIKHEILNTFLLFQESRFCVSKVFIGLEAPPPKLG